jgi:hypothetical protein
MSKVVKKPRLNIVGGDGNAFFILGKALVAAKKAGWSQEKIQEFSDKARAGDYDNLLTTCMDYFDVE